MIPCRVPGILPIEIPACPTRILTAVIDWRLQRMQNTQESRWSQVRMAGVRSALHRPFKTTFERMDRHPTWFWVHFLEQKT